MIQRLAASVAAIVIVTLSMLVVGATRADALPSETAAAFSPSSSSSGGGGGFSGGGGGGW